MAIHDERHIPCIIGIGAVVSDLPMVELYILTCLPIAGDKSNQANRYESIIISKWLFTVNCK